MKTAPYSILAAGPFQRDQVLLEFDPLAELQLEAAIRQLVGTRWNEAAEEARRRGALFFNGPLYRLREFETTGGRLCLRLGPTDYRTFVATRGLPASSQLHSPGQAHPLAVCVAVLTGDGQLLVERRQGVDLDEGRHHVIGGFVDRQEDGGDTPDVFAAMARELREEVGLDLPPGDLECLGLAYDRRVPHPELCFGATTPRTLQQVRQLPNDGEIRHLEGLSAEPDDLAGFLRQSHGAFSHTGFACLRLWGAQRFGGEWERTLLS